MERTLEMQTEEIGQVKSDLKSLKSHTENRFSYLEKEMKSSRRMLAQIASGLGTDFEKFNAQWVRFYLKKQGFPSDKKLTIRHKEKDLKKEVHPKSSEFEVDIVCWEPFLVVEATSYLGESEFQKLDDFLKKVYFMEKRYEMPAEKIVCCLAVDSTVKQKVDSFCANNGVTLIAGE
jgi:hypothetical protein